MKNFVIHSLEVRNFRGIDHAFLEPKAKGVSVIIGENESGKSSLMDAFLFLLEKKHTAADKDVKAAIPNGKNELPQITAELTVGEQRLKMSKTYGAGSRPKSSAELHILEPVKEKLAGEKAHDKFENILKENLDEKLKNALFVHQGESIHSVVGKDIDALSQALQRKQGDASISGNEESPLKVSADYLDSSQASQLLKEVEQEKLIYFTPTGKKKGLYSKAEKEKKAAGEDLREKNQDLSHAESLIEKLNSLNKEVRSYDHEIPDVQRKVEHLGKEVEQAKEKDSRRSQLVQALDFAHIQWEHAKQDIQHREEKNSELEKLARDKKNIVEELAELEERKDHIEQKIVKIDSQKRLINSLRTLARSRGSWLEAMQDQYDLEEKTAQDKAIIKELEEQQEQRLKLEEEIRDLRIDQEILERIEKTKSEVTTHSSILANLATKVRIDIPEGEELFLDGVLQKTSSEEFDVNSPSTFAFGEDQRYKVTITPEKSAVSVQEELRLAQEELQRLLDFVQVSDVDHAYRDHRHKLDLEKQLALLNQEMRTKLKDRDLDQLRSDVESAETRTEALRIRVDEEMGIYSQAWEEYSSAYPEGIESTIFTETPRLGDMAVEPLIADPAVIKGDQREKLAENRFLIEQLNDLKEDLSQHLDELKEDPNRDAYAFAKARLETAQSRYESVLAELNEEREQESDEALSQKVESTKELMTTAQNSLEFFERENKDIPDLETVVNDLEIAKAKLENKRSLREKIKRDFDRMQGQLENQRGLPEKKQEAQRRLEEAERVFNQIDCEASAALKLYQVMSDLYEEIHEKYQAPFAQTFNELAALVFSKSDFTFDENLQIVSRNKEGIQLPITQLSQGTQEQIHLLVRLSIASLTGEGTAVPIFIDDALGFSDSGRLDSMNLALKKLGETHQVIVTTCEGSRFDAIRGAQIEFMQDILRKSDHEPA